MRNAGLDEAQAGIKIAGRNINNLRYVDDTTPMAESKEELKSLLMKVKEESEKFGFTLNIQKTKIMVSGPITENRREKSGSSNRFYVLGLQIHCRLCIRHLKTSIYSGKELIKNRLDVLSTLMSFREPQTW